MRWQSNAKLNEPLENGSIFRCEYGDVVIHRVHGLDGWFLTCPKLSIDAAPLYNAITFKDAVDYAQYLVKSKLEELESEYSFFLNSWQMQFVRHLV